MNNQSCLSILVVEDDENFINQIKNILSFYNSVFFAKSISEAKSTILNNRFDISILDYYLPDGYGSDLIPEITKHPDNGPILFLSSSSEQEIIKKCLSLGAKDYLYRNSTLETDLLLKIRTVIQLSLENRRYKELLQREKESFKYELIGTSKTITNLRNHIEDLKDMNSTSVLICGPTGSGKELVARRINKLQDKYRPFLALNCSNIPDESFESTMFGHKRGAFHGATTNKLGIVETCDGGDLFLDEITDLSHRSQSKLLRFLEEGEFTPLGSNQIKRVDVRVIAATNVNIEKLVEKNLFRRDLYYRINVARINTSPLIEYREDIPCISKFLLMTLSCQKCSISENAIKYLQSRPQWDGNVRELRNSLEVASFRAKKRDCPIINIDDFSSMHSQSSNSFKLPREKSDLTSTNYETFIKNSEKDYLITALNLCNNNASELARSLNISPSSIFRKINELGIREQLTSL